MLVLAAVPPHYPFLPISLNSLDLVSVILFSPRDSLILPNKCRCRRYQCRWRNRDQVGVRRGTWSLLCFFSWWSVVEPSWDDRGSSIWGYLISFGFDRSRSMCGFWMMYEFIYVLCEVAIVSQLFIPFLFITWDCVKMTLLATKPQCGYASMSCLDTWEI